MSIGARSAFTDASSIAGGDIDDADRVRRVDHISSSITYLRARVPRATRARTLAHVNRRTQDAIAAGLGSAITDARSITGGDLNDVNPV